MHGDMGDGRKCADLLSWTLGNIPLRNDRTDNAIYFCYYNGGHVHCGPHGPDEGCDTQTTERNKMNEPTPKICTYHITNYQPAICSVCAKIVALAHQPSELTPEEQLANARRVIEEQGRMIQELTKAPTPDVEHLARDILKGLYPDDNKPRPFELGIIRAGLTQALTPLVNALVEIRHRVIPNNCTLAEYIMHLQDIAAVALTDTGEKATSDSVRLDWLEQNVCDIDCIRLPKGRPIREAIDEAMAK